MKKQQIQKLLKGLIDNLCEEIDHDTITDILKNRCYITGGCIPSMMLDEWVNDFDFYFMYQKDVDVIKEWFEKNRRVGEKYEVKLITENAINLSDKVQFITKFVGYSNVVIDKFDWQHIKSYYMYDIDIVLCDDLYRLLMEKELVYTGSEYPLSSMMRLKKYIKKGWSVSNKTILEIALDMLQAFNKKEKSNYEKHLDRLKKEIFEVTGLPKAYLDPAIQNPCEEVINEEVSEGLFTQSMGPGPEFNDPEFKPYIERDENYKEPEDEFKLDVDTVLFHLNGVDPITIQARLLEKTGTQLTVKEIIELIN